MTSHIKRWITGIIAVPLLFAIIWYTSETMFSVVIVVIILCALHEYNCITFNKEGFRLEKYVGTSAAFLLSFAAFTSNTQIILSVLSLSFIAIFILFLLKTKDHPFEPNSLGKVIFGFLYIPFMLSHLILMRQSVDGIMWIIFVLVLAFSGDITAYYVGKGLGKRKLLPEVSPGKTVEGAVGGLAGSICGCVVFQILLFPSLSIVHAIILGFLGGILGQLGDLCESAIKRASGVKDSGTILQGHGGWLDRLDCLIFIIPFIYYYRLFMIL